MYTSGTGYCRPGRKKQQLMNFPHFPYIITELYCAAFAVTIWLRLNRNIGTEHEVRQFRNMIYSYTGLLITDILWALMEDGILHLPNVLNAFINAVGLISVTCGCYFWFRYIEDRAHFSFASSRILDAVLAVPLLIVCVLDLSSVFTGWIFYIDPQGYYTDTPHFVIYAAVNYFYLLVPTVYSIYRAVKTPLRQERSEYLTYSLYMIAPLISGILEGFFTYVPLLALNIFLMILIMYLMIQNKQIYNDALTGLNNRSRLDRYLESCLLKASPGHPLLLFIMDINSFKSINDIYGHLEGDRALKLFAEILKKIASRYNAFAARYGGDEFCLVIDAPGIAPEEIAEDIHRTLEKAQAGGTAYTLTVCIGYTVCDGSESSTDAALAKADGFLYESKKAWHDQRR